MGAILFAPVDFFQKSLSQGTNSSVQVLPRRGASDSLGINREVVEKPYHYFFAPDSLVRESGKPFFFDRRRSPMAVMNLESLVLCGSAVLRGGKAGNLRRGTSYAANPETPEIRISMRHPSPGCGQEFQPAMRLSHADDLRSDYLAAFGAGRSRSRAGVLSPSCLRRTTGRRTTSPGGVSPVAVTVVMRGRGDRLWCKPGRTTHPVSTWGTGVC